MSIRTKIKTYLAENGLLYGIGIILCLGLKHYYSQAGNDDLHWILIPTSRVVEYLSGIHFEREFHIGLVNHAHRFIIISSCAGINFLTISFSTLFFSFLHRLEGVRLKILWLVISAGFAYLLTLVANALRIIAAIYLYRADIYGGWVTPGRVHRIEGTFIYFVFLLIAYLTAEKIVQEFIVKAPEEKISAANGKEFIHTLRRCLTPFFWYFLIGFGIPILRMAHKQDGARFMEHLFLVTSVCLCILLLLILMRFGYRKVLHGTKQLNRNNNS